MVQRNRGIEEVIVIMKPAIVDEAGRELLFKQVLLGNVVKLVGDKKADGL